MALKTLKKEGNTSVPDIISNPMIDDAVAEALQLNLCFLNGPGQVRHVPFTFSPTSISGNMLHQLESVAPLLGRLTQAVANRNELIQAVHAPLVAADAFFAEMLAMHQELHNGVEDLPRVPLLLQRSDFLVDEHAGARLVECNSIAAGMAPFGERAHVLHKYIEGRWPAEFGRFHTTRPGAFLHNPATDNMARAIASAARQMDCELGTDAEHPGFLMVVQENEDNLFDQRLLERRLQELGLRTHRRTFRELHEQLSSGPNQSLQLADCGTIHVVYLRAGYQYQDYIATDLDARRCCDAICATRILIERHRVAVNATVAQQLATSKRMQLHLAGGGDALLEELGFSRQEREIIGSVFASMRSVDAGSAARLHDENATGDWVLKNQGEGGGHCLFDREILSRLDKMAASEYPAWVLMQRLRPVGRAKATLVIRNGKAQRVERLVSEIGLFTAHMGGQALPIGNDQSGNIGYLVRSKPPDVTEGGIHSGFGALDSLFVEN
ncbi:MAG: glutathione synthase [Halioglobus sp.]